MPPAVAFLFDSEGRSDRAREDIERRARGLVHWLPRRMFENYLIEPDAIAALINGEDNRDMPVTNSEVEEWLRENGSSDKFFAAKSGVAYSDPAWHELVHGAELLKSLLYSLTECRVRYDKVRHGEVLTRYIVRKPSPAVIDLAELVADLCVQ